MSDYYKFDSAKLDAYLTREPDFCDIEEYTPEHCDACRDNDTCEVYLYREYEPMPDDRSYLLNEEDC